VKDLTRREFVGAALAGAVASALPSCVPPELREARPWVWSGALASRSAVVHARTPGSMEPLVLFEGADSTPTGERDPTRIGPSGVMRWELSGLRPDTLYRYRVGDLEGQLRTASELSGSHRVALGCCADIGSSHPVFDAIREREPLFFLHMGDLHYRDIGSNDRERYLRAFDEALSTPAQSRFFASTPVEYVWDDHDYGTNNSNRNAAGRPAAMSAFRECAPHHALALSGPLEPIARAFSIGRVRYVLTDCRSARSPLDAASPTMLGEAQKAWLLGELSAASRAHALVVWMSPVPWIAGGSDTWGGYPEERREIANHIASEGIRNLCMVSGDAHMLAIDDGRNNDFATLSGGPGFPVFQAGALDRGGSIKGGPYTHGPRPGGGHFGEMDITDSGEGAVEVTWRGRAADGTVHMELTFEAEPG
tara:strand:- start:7286 stop:8551 length:1266 start_codon:yes stop_codon:yes gene_type:complete